MHYFRTETITSTTTSTSTASSTAVTSTSSARRDTYSEILGDIEIPDGVDPSFLAALPEEMRQEVIAEQMRLQRVRTRVPPPTTEASASAADGITPGEVNPEFLAALPPNIQEEVLAQQRLEQDRQRASTANPDDPVDPDNFIRSLPPQLRQQVM